MRGLWEHDTQDALLLVEHPPTYTLGVRTDPANILVEPSSASLSEKLTKLKAARASRDYLKVLEHGEEILARNPWDVGTQMDMAHFLPHQHLFVAREAFRIMRELGVFDA